MTVISASTLCAEPKNLKPGVPRSYNVIEIDADAWTGRVHQRQMINQIFNLPIWGPGHFTSTNRSYFDFDLCKPLEARSTERDNQLLLKLIDEQVGNGHYNEALKTIRNARHIPLARPYLVKVVEAINDPRTTIAELWPPHTVPEAIALGGAVFEAGSKQEAIGFSQLSIVSSSTDASLKHISNQIIERRLK